MGRREGAAGGLMKQAGEEQDGGNSWGCRGSQGREGGESGRERPLAPLLPRGRDGDHSAGDGAARLAVWRPRSGGAGLLTAFGRAALAGILGQWPAEACPSGSSVPERVPKDWPPLPWALVHRGRHSRWPRGQPDRAVHPDRGLPCGFFLCRVWGLRQGRAQASPSQDPGLAFGG